MNELICMLSIIIIIERRWTDLGIECHFPEIQKFRLLEGRQVEINIDNLHAIVQFQVVVLFLKFVYVRDTSSGRRKSFSSFNKHKTVICYASFLQCAGTSELWDRYIEKVSA